ncbi:carboxypeptidase regulatory-like domain-containing protein [Moheibacter stercoris]|uniref:Fibronectin type-III domain-containing protein n=1 Tax=Moheibacter stercoris TaxID=1628251 RepID=A0ABV2LTN9_9FLAO
MRTLRQFLLMVLMISTTWLSAQLHGFMDDVENQTDFAQTGLTGWTSLDLDGLNTAGPFQSFPGKGGPLGFIVYNPSQTDPVNTLDGYDPRSGQKYFASISSWSGPNNDWLISDELAAHPGGTFSFYAKSAADFSGLDQFKVAYSTTTNNPADFVFLNGGNPISTTINWVKYDYTIPANAKYIAVNCVSYAFMMLLDDLSFTPTVAATAPNSITNFSMEAQIDSQFRAVLNWTNPTIDFQGNTLTDLTGVKIYRGTHPMNLQLVTTLTSSVGQAQTYTDILPGEGSYIYRLVPYNAAGDGKSFDTPLTYFGYETTPGAPQNVNFSQNASLQTVISWDEVNYGSGGGVLQDPVVGYTIKRTLGTTTEVLAEMHPSTTFTETTIPEFNLYTYSIQAQTSETNLGIATVVSSPSGLAADQVRITSGTAAKNQPFELGNKSIISQSIYYPSDLGETGVITSISYFANLASPTTARYKIYMSTTDRDVFGTTLNNAIWEFYGDQKLVYDGEIQFISGRKAMTIDLDQPFFYDTASGQNIIISIVKPYLENVPTFNPREFYNTPVEGMRTYYANGYTVDLSVVTTQPAAWSTDEVTSIPSIVLGKASDYGSLSGQVIREDDGTALEGVSVQLTPTDENSYQSEVTLTNVFGNYEIRGILPGNYTVTFTKDTYNTETETISIVAGEEEILDVEMNSAIPISIAGTVVNVQGQPIADATLNLSGFSTFTTTTNATGSFVLEAYAGKEYDLEASHPLFVSETISFVSESTDFTLDPIELELALNKPGSVIAVNNNGVGEVSWQKPVGMFNETQIGWGSFLAAGDAWGNGGNPFIAGIRLEPADLANQLEEGAKLTHVKIYYANNANTIIHIYKGANASELIHSQPFNVTTENWYTVELTSPIEIDQTQELWIGVEFLAGQYGAYPIGLDDGPNAPARKGSMLNENGTWVGMSLTNKNWNIYGIANNTMEANPEGYKVFRSPAAEENWTELTPSMITALEFDDTTLSSAPANMYKYGVEALYGENLISEKGISNEIEHGLYFDFTLTLNPDSGNATGAYVSMWNDVNFAEATITNGNTITLSHLMIGTYNLRVELDTYEIIELNDVVVSNEGSLTLPLNLLKVQPSNLTADVQGNTAELHWTLHDTFTEKFERYPDFERNTIGNYILRDLDGLETYTYTNFSWPNDGDPMSFMIFNPFATTPPVNIPALSGRRFLSAFAGPDGANNDWIIIPAGPGEFKFMASSLTNELLERIRVYYSTSGTETSDFQAFGSQITVPTAWTEYTFEAPENTRYVAINYVSNDSYILKIEDMTFEKEYNHALYYRVYLDNVLVADNLTEQNFLLENLTGPTHVAHVEAVYGSGNSEKTEIILSLLGVEDPNLAQVSVYPNPASGKFWIKTDLKGDMKVMDLNGRLMYSGKVQVGTNFIEHTFETGTYIVQIQTEKGIISKKLLIK